MSGNLATEGERATMQEGVRGGMGGVTQRVFATLLSDPKASEGMEAVARSLAMSPRTLRRRLAADGVGYRTLLARARLTRARELLRESPMTLREIADYLGYADSSSFHHSFRRQMGMTPSDYQRSSALNEHGSALIEHSHTLTERSSSLGEHGVSTDEVRRDVVVHREENGTYETAAEAFASAEGALSAADRELVQARVHEEPRPQAQVVAYRGGRPAAEQSI